MESITTIKKLQDYIYLLNESSNKSKLRLNKKSSDEFNLIEELNSFFDILSNSFNVKRCSSSKFN